MTGSSDSIGIVVGVDGSASSKHALGWAARQAKLTGEPLVAVAAWRLPTSYGWAVPMPDSTEIEAKLHAMLDEAVREAVGDDSEIKASQRVIPGPAALVLVDLSENASLLVVGSRGRGEFLGMLLGSVSEHVITHAHCPVVVLRDHSAAASPD